MDSTELGASRRRNRQTQVQDDGKDNGTPEWTAVLSVFLARLAASGRFRLTQCWETRSYEVSGAFDLAWFRSGVKSPVVLIEHESDAFTFEGEGSKSRPARLSIAGGNAEASKLAQALGQRTTPELCVLITYPWTNRLTSRKDPSLAVERSLGLIVNGVKRATRSCKKRSRFLLVVGQEGWSPRLSWRGWRWTGNRFTEIEPGRRTID